jgi:hypothetical protein
VTNAANAAAININRVRHVLVIAVTPVGMRGE